MSRKLGMGAVDLRVVEVGLVDPGLEVVRDQPPGHATEERERLHMRGGPLGLVHAQRRADEHVPRARQHHHKRPHRASSPRPGIEPHPQPPVVDLRLRTGRRALTQHRDLPATGLLGQVGRHPAAHAGHRRPQTLLIDQALMDRRRAHPHLELGGDVVPMALDHRPAGLPQPGVDQLREPVDHQRAPVRLTHWWATRLHPGRPSRAGVLAQRLTVHAQAARELVLRPARIPVGQDLHDVDHFEGPPRQRLLPPRCPTTRTEPVVLRGPGPGPTRTHSPMRNYVIAG
jgi:hypothetical protein